MNKSAGIGLVKTGPCEGLFSCNQAHELHLLGALLSKSQLHKTMKV